MKPVGILLIFTAAARAQSENPLTDALGNYNFCGVFKGEKPPDMRALHALTTKADLVKALTASFEFCDAALKDMDDRKALDEFRAGGKARAAGKQ